MSKANNAQAELVGRLRRAAVGCPDGGRSYVPRGVDAQDCVLAAAEIERMAGVIAALREALAPFANPPLYVFDAERLFAPTPRPEGWIGGGLFSTEDFRRAQRALGGGE